MQLEKKREKILVEKNCGLCYILRGLRITSGEVGRLEETRSLNFESFSKG